MQSSASGHVEVSITIDGVTHSLTWSPGGHVGLFRRERGELSTAGVGRWDGARLDLQRGAIRPELRVALEGSLRLALTARAAAAAPGAPEPRTSARAARLRGERARSPESAREPGAPAPRSGPGLASIDVVYEGDDVVCFRRALIPPA
ncbi:MAG: hypothetical protein IT372_20425 [Polyangiaceae bacterium]|nr:hypothetical protein [Polyangiaceae bacterium]